MTAQTLLLTPWMAPHQVISWQAAVTLSYLGKVDVLETYEDEIRSPNMTIRAPAVVRLKRHAYLPKRGVKFSRTNVFVRDEFRCQYCGVAKDGEHLTYDHVVPRVQGGRTVWENIVASCRDCNAAVQELPGPGLGLRRHLPAQPMGVEARHQGLGADALAAVVQPQRRLARDGGQAVALEVREGVRKTRRVVPHLAGVGDLRAEVRGGGAVQPAIGKRPCAGMERNRASRFLPAEDAVNPPGPGAMLDVPYTVERRALNLSAPGYTIGEQGDTRRAPWLINFHSTSCLK